MLGGLPCLSTIVVQDSWYWPCSVNPGQPWKLTGSSILWTQNPFKLRKPCRTLLTWEFTLHLPENSSSYTFLCCQSLWMEPFLIMSWERGLLPAVDWQAKKKKKKKASLPCSLSLISASCTELVVQWGVGHRKAFVLPLLCSNNSFVELDCDKSWHLHCPGLGIITTHSIRSKSRLACIVFSTQQSLLRSQYCNEWQTWSQSLCVCARLHRHDLIRVPNLLHCL